MIIYYQKLRQRPTRKKEFAQLTNDEVLTIERKYDDIFQGSGCD